MTSKIKIRDGFILKSVAGKNIVVSVGAEVNFNGMLTLNDTGTFFWQLLQSGTTKEEMIKSVTSEYDIDEKTASADIDSFIDKLRAADILEA